MIQRFQDREPGDQHEQFEDWKERNPDGFVINVRAAGRAKFHRAQCRKFAGPHQTPAEGKSRTARLKLCSIDRSELFNEASRLSLVVQNCGSCKP